MKEDWEKHANGTYLASPASQIYQGGVLTRSAFRYFPDRLACVVHLEEVGQSFVVYEQYLGHLTAAYA